VLEEMVGESASSSQGSGASLKGAGMENSFEGRQKIGAP
jgi:hypothetical protein